jgi:SHS2 domain-containing protein
MEPEAGSEATMAARHGITGAPAAAKTARGHASLPHTADVRIEAWARTPEECYEEAVAAFVDIFADVTHTSAGRPRPFHVGPGSPELLLILLLDEVLLAVDVEGLVPRSVHVERPGRDNLDGLLSLVPVDEVQVVGSVAKGVSHEGLLFGTRDGSWRCQATVDV